MNNTFAPDDIPADSRTYVTVGEPNTRCDAPPVGNIVDRTVSVGGGGTAQVPGTRNSVRSRRDVNRDDQFRQLEVEVQQCTDQLAVDLQESLLLSARDAKEQVRRGVGSLLKTQLKRLAASRHGQQRRAMIRQTRRLLRDFRSVEAQVRCYARYAFRRMHKDWAERRRKKHARTAPLDELLAELGHDQSAVERYYERRLVRSEQAARHVLERFGLQTADADRYLRRLREQRPKEFADMLGELVEIEHSPAQHPAQGRAGVRVPGVDAQALVERIDALLSLRAEARVALQNAQWGREEIASRLRNCSRADLEAIKDLPGPPQPQPSAPADLDDSNSQESQHRDRESMTGVTTTYDRQRVQ